MSKLKDIDTTNQISEHSRVGPKIPKLNETVILERKMRGENWVPPKWEPARPGADDHKQFKSRGVA